MAKDNVIEVVRSALFDSLWPDVNGVLARHGLKEPHLIRELESPAQKQRVLDAYESHRFAPALRVLKRRATQLENVLTCIDELHRHMAEGKASVAFPLDTSTRDRFQNMLGEIRLARRRIVQRRQYYRSG